MNALHIVMALNYLTFARNVISLLVEALSLVMVKIGNFCKNEMIEV